MATFQLLSTCSILLFFCSVSIAVQYTCSCIKYPVLCSKQPTQINHCAGVVAFFVQHCKRQGDTWWMLKMSLHCAAINLRDSQIYFRSMKTKLFQKYKGIKAAVFRPLCVEQFINIIRLFSWDEHVSKRSLVHVINCTFSIESFAW